MEQYHAALAALNAAQRQAVDTIDGPVLVLAGPGTGKTQLLAIRAAHILAKTDTLPQQILCLTFTENGAENMRERLTRFIGQDAHAVHISTYHAFGSEIIRRFPQAFARLRLQSPVDELTKHRVLKEIVDSLGYEDPLKQTRHHLGDLIGTISEVKRALLDAASLRKIAAENQAFITAATSSVQTILADVTTLPRTTAKALPLFEVLLVKLRAHVPGTPAHPQFGSLAAIAINELEEATREAADTNKTTPLTAWKNKWLAKDTANKFVFDGALQNQRIISLAAVCERYDAALAGNGWYDFDDMIMLAGKALAEQPELRYTLQEQYLYIMLDEFQDTNAAQLKLVQLLSDSPVHEGRPNVLAVGDDDQAIYAFQGAEYSNMLDFYQMYKDVRVVTLTDNYRSSPEILHAAGNIANQIQARLVHQFKDASKTLTAQNTSLPAAHIERREFISDINQYDWMAQRIEELIQKGVSPRQIAVLAPKHRQLEPLVPYLARRGVPMRYEKREDVLEAPVVKQLLAMSRLVLALHTGDRQTANALWPVVLSFDFWQIPVQKIWQLSWQVNDTAKDETPNWSKALLAQDDPALTAPALLLLGLTNKVPAETCERMLDYLIGSEAVNTHHQDITVRSPLREYYLGKEIQTQNPSLFYDTISHLTVLRAKLRGYQATQDSALTLPALINLVDMYHEAQQRLPSTSPYNQQADAVQLMTVFKAKGLEFEHVFLPSCQDEVWGSSARGNANKLTLPPNLAPIRRAGASEDERLRILFVAVTRAKAGLHLASFTHTYSDKNTKRLKYLDEQEQDDGSFKSLVLPGRSQQVIISDHQAPPLELLELNWQQPHIDARGSSQLRALLAQRLERYQISPTHVTRFIDLVYGGPESFFFANLLRFPTAPSAQSQFGEAMHETLEWVQLQTTKLGHPPAASAAVAYFSACLARSQLTSQEREIEEARGTTALRAYLTQRGASFKPGDRAEYNFKNEGVFVGPAHLSGKIDRLLIDHAAKTITVVDYKTAKSFNRWTRHRALHKYRLQLYLYKALVEGSRSFRGYRVDSAYLDFVEPDTDGLVHQLHLTFDEAEYTRAKQLLEVIWRRIMRLNLPDVSSYSPDLTGIEAFEQDLLNG